MNKPILLPFVACCLVVVNLQAQDMPLSQVLVAGEDWELAVEGIGFSDGPTADDEGNFYFSDMKSEQGLFRVSPDGKKDPFLKGASGISGMKFGPDGNLHACRARFRELVCINIRIRTERIKCRILDILLGMNSSEGAQYAE